MDDRRFPVFGTPLVPPHPTHFIITLRVRLHLRRPTQIPRGLLGQEQFIDLHTYDVDEKKKNPLYNYSSTYKR